MGREDSLRRLQLEELDILKEFIRICQENNLRYYALGGTFLGAVRHNGFIPWDDDVDVCMPREDYNKFLELKEDKFRDGYRLVNYTNDKDYRYSWARLQKDTIKIINRSANIPREECAWIDLIPMDGFPSKGIKKIVHKTRLSFWWNLNQILQFNELVDQKRKRSLAGTVAIKAASLFTFLNKIIDYRKCLIKINETLMKYPYDSDTEYVINYLAAYGFKETFERTKFDKPAKYKFEDIEIIGSADYDHILSTIYSDTYMELPPLEDRNKHNAEIVEAGKDNS